MNKFTVAESQYDDQDMLLVNARISETSGLMLRLRAHTAPEVVGARYFEPSAEQRRVAVAEATQWALDNGYGRFTKAIVPKP